MCQWNAKLKIQFANIHWIRPGRRCVSAHNETTTCARIFSFEFFLLLIFFFVCVITHLRMAHWSFAHNNDMLVLPTHKWTLEQPTTRIQHTGGGCTRQDGRVMHEHCYEKHENGVFCCWIFIIKKRRKRRRGQYVCLVYREMKCIHIQNAMILCRLQTTERRVEESAVYLIETNMFILKIYKTHFESRNDDWNEHRLEKENEKKKKRWNCYMHIHTIIDTLA